MKKSILSSSVLTAAAAVLFSAAACFAAPSWDIPDEVSQGRAFQVRITDDAPFRGTVRWNKAVFPVVSSPEGSVHSALVLLAMPIDAASPLKADANLGTGRLTANVMPLAVQWAQYKMKIAPKYVTPPKDTLERIDRERQASRKALATATEQRCWSLPFFRPVPGTISSAYGGRRVLNGQHLSPHMGTDLRGPVGTPVRAVADGTVIMTAEQYFAGNVIFVDHGQNVISMYCHLSEISVQKGQKVTRGQDIGNVGATGRVTGPHLHSALYVGGTPVDIIPLFEEHPSPVGGPTKDQPRK